jgi:hypothetical protein
MTDTESIANTGGPPPGLGTLIHAPRIDAGWATVPGGAPRMGQVDGIAPGDFGVAKQVASLGGMNLARWGGSTAVPSRMPRAGLARSAL